MIDLTQLEGGLIVSCQAYPGEPMDHAETMAQLAEAAADGRAGAVRLQGLDAIRLGRERLAVPIVGLVKRGADGVFITPTLDDALAVAETGAAIVALDGTRRSRPDGRTLAATVAAIRSESDVAIMADCGSVDDALSAADGGVDLIGTTLAGYTAERPRTDGPDLALVAEIAARIAVPVIAEGRIHSAAQAVAAMRAGAHAVCVGTAITHPTSITSAFVDALDDR
ncbi:N-acetylmannosamine-6-phosphate 2-epimerase [Microbacterium karelineae]|uniref:N-acetylmannosamine-6-phosphate 2-epimerase n=1 Tax=Microbacterium karelineae TaxID=2654283 RepID=UPI0012E9FBDB|nr:N-acetylmannosamine-6-phosphate 2-epimerase [Microbacterium karelineae]